MLNILDNILDRCYDEKSHLGYFPALYRKVTLKVKKGIENNLFEDNLRMDRFDTQFAGRYFKALFNFWEGKECSKCWQLAFSAPQNLNLVQHLFLGMNAHINFDLGLSAADLMEGKDLIQLEDDFGKINQILISMIQSNQELIDKLSPWFNWLDSILGTADECFAKFSLVAARKFAWNWAQEISLLKGDSAALRIQHCDEKVKDLGCLISSPGIFTRLFLKLAKFREEKNPQKIIRLFLDSET